MSSPAHLTLSPRAAARVALGYPWVFRSDVAAGGALAGLSPGDTVHFCDAKGTVLATGYAHPKTQLAGRVLAKGAVDPRTGRRVGDYANWTTHPNNPSVRAAE